MGAAVDVVQVRRRAGARSGLGNAVEQETSAVTSLQHRVELRGDDDGAVVGAKRLLVRYAAERQAAVGLLPLVFLVAGPRRRWPGGADGGGVGRRQVGGIHRNPVRPLVGVGGVALGVGAFVELRQRPA